MNSQVFFILSKIVYNIGLWDLYLFLFNFNELVYIFLFLCVVNHNLFAPLSLFVDYLHIIHSEIVS